MQADIMTWLYKYGIWAALIIGAIVVAALVRRFGRGQVRKLDDSDKLAAPSYERMDSGVKISVDDEDDDDNP